MPDEFSWPYAGPWRSRRGRCDVLYGATPVELGLAPSPYRLPCDTLSEMERRRLLRLLTTALAAPVLVRGKAGAGNVSGAIDADRLARALERPSGTDRTVVSTVASSILDARRHDDVSGPRIAVHMALAQRDILRALLEGGPSEAARSQLAVAAGEVSQLLGWLAHDMNDEATSLRYLDEALSIAYQTDAHDLAAYVLGHRSIVEIAGGRPQQALAYAETARNLAEAKAAPGLRSFLAGRKAAALANLGDRNGAERALDRARRNFARSKREDNPSWLYFWDEPALNTRSGPSTRRLVSPSRLVRSSTGRSRGLILPGSGTGLSASLVSRRPTSSTESWKERAALPGTH